jgi:DNA-binding CsgD family transcriptional regulator
VAALEEHGTDLKPSVPRCLGAAVERVVSTRGHAVRTKRAFAHSVMPMVLVDDERRHLDVNPSARLIFRLCLEELQRLRIDDLTPSHQQPIMREAWARLMTTGCVAGPHEVAAPDGTCWPIHYYGLANALPEQHLIAFAPAWWPDGELVRDMEQLDGGPVAPLTPRELEVLSLASEGLSGPMIANELVVSTATVRTHFEHIYAKLAVSDRGAAVARAMRLGLIA